LSKLNGLPAAVPGGLVPLTPELLEQRARLAALRRHHPDQPDVGADERRALKEAALARHIRKLVDTDPPLTAEQRIRLGALLLTTGGDGDATA
jgi:hypothetical protein